MAKVAKVGKDFFVHDAKRGWLDASGEVAVVKADHGTKFFNDEAEAAKAGYKSKPETPKV